MNDILVLILGIFISCIISIGLYCSIFIIGMIILHIPLSLVIDVLMS
jgi:uncharacterized membrane protein